MFLRHAWPYVPRAEGELVLAGYIPVACNYLQAAFEGRLDKDDRKLDRLLFNLPPESLKSTLFSVVFPAYVWSRDPQAGILSVCYDGKLGSRDASDARALMESTWYRILWPELEFRDDTNAKSNYRNKAGGWRIATTRRGRITGEHPRFFIWEDPLNIRDAYDDRVKSDLKYFYQKQVSTRGRSKGVVHIVSQQRVANDDPSSIAYEANDAARLEGRKEPWTIVKFPMRYDPSIAMKDYGFGGDFRTEPGQLLDPVRLPGPIVDDMERSLGEDAPAQLAQNPLEVKGRTFQPERLVDIEMHEVPKDLEEVVRFWDKAATPDGGCETAGVLMGKKSRQIGPPSILNPPHVDLYIIDVHAGQWGVDQVEQEIVLCKDVDLQTWGYDRYRVGMEEEGGSGGKVSARSTEKLMRGVRFEAISPTGNKDARAKPLAREVRLGNVFIVRGKWTPVFKQRMQFFPNGKLKDQIDAAGGAHLMLEGTLGKPKKPKRALMSGLSGAKPMCTSPGCDHPAAKDSQYCCQSCEQIAAFNDPTMVCKDDEHSDECKLRYFESRQ